MVLTDVPDLCQVSVGPSVGRSDTSALFLTLKLEEPARHFDLASSVPLLSRVNWRGVCDALSPNRWGPIFKSHSMIEDLDNQLSEVLLRFVLMVTVRRRSGDSPWFDDECRIASVERGVGLAVGRMLTGISLFVHAVRKKHVMLLPKLVILSDVFRDLMLHCLLVIGGGL